MKKKNIVIITSRHPATLGKGDTLIMRHRIAEFTKAGHCCSILVLQPCFGFLSHVVDENTEQFNIKYFKLKICFFDLFITNFILPILSPVQVRFFSGYFARRVLFDFCKCKNFDFAIFYTLRCSFYKGAVSLEILEAIDSLSVNFQSLSHRCYLPKRLLYRLEALLLKYWEIYRLRSFDLVTLVNSSELTRINATNVISLANGVELLDHQSFDKSDFIVCLSGNMKYLPNIEAYHFFCDIAKSVKEKRPNIEFRVIGRYANTLPSSVLVAYCSDPVDIYKELSKSFISLCPVKSGSGMQNKILEGIATSNFVVASSFSLRAFGDIVSQECIVANNLDEYVDHIVRIYDQNVCRYYPMYFLESLSWGVGAEAILKYSDVQGHA